MPIYTHITGLIQQTTKAMLIDQADEIYVRNQILALLQLEAFPDEKIQGTDDTIPNLVEKLIDFAMSQHVIEDVFDEKEMLAAKIMNCFIDRPSIINEKFTKNYKTSPKNATDYFYHLSKNSNYIQMNRIRKNVHFNAETVYGNLDITINLSKPEKDPLQIKRERELKQQVHYPSCVLCIENEGYVGRTGYAARANHRIIHVPLLNENWYFQYSPYVYYNEHSILLSEEHRDMKINRDTFKRLLAFVEKFPHYFIGSNADLPIVGGSILDHDHYQAGKYEFPMVQAENIFEFSLDAYSSVTASVLNWPLATIRLRSSNASALVAAADDIFLSWKNYSDEEVYIKAFTDGIQHNTVTPIARMRGNEFELDIVLRNNRTTKQYPFGIFHPHEDVHHIKRENIGLIEVMGLAVLPGRLKEELQQMTYFLLDEPNNVAHYHLTWAEEIKQKYSSFKKAEEVKEVLEKELGIKFARVLEDAGVFKQTQVGIEAFKRFINQLNNGE